MIKNYLVIGFIGFICRAAILLGRNKLPRERWQFFASIPVNKEEEGSWKAVNITWYGLILSTSTIFAVLVYLIMLGAVGVKVEASMALMALLLLICVPAASLVARIVERKPATLTIGGAAFVGGIAAPFLILLLNRFAIPLFGAEIPMTQALAACAVAFLFGEGMGRLACLSYGCCYGKPVDEYRGILKKFFTWCAVVFEGENKKIAYAAGLDGHRIVPIQLITMLASSCAGVLTLLLYAEGKPLLAYLAATAFAGFWRIFSEFFRNDYRGGGKVSAYQLMSVLSVIFTVGVSLLLTGGNQLPTVDLLQGAMSLWSPGILVALFLAWLGLVCFTGISTTTYSRISFHLHRDRI
jgi:prolipoprotein diacylglyceryltransferase